MKPGAIQLGCSVAVAILETSQVGIARRAAGVLCANLGFHEAKAEQVRIVVTEASKNILKHAGSGIVVLRGFESSGTSAVEVLALDKGLGISDVSRAMEDGYSTAGSPGTGMGAMRRLSDVFDVYTQPGGGTALLAQVWSKPELRHSERMVIGCICVPRHSGEPSGDQWSVQFHPGSTRILVVDGLGHGLHASEAAHEAVRVFNNSQSLEPVEVIQTMHSAMRHTRGASLAVAQVEHAANRVRYTGVGNISGAVLFGVQTRGMVSHNGTVGHELHRVKEFEYEWNPGCSIVMHSDGLGSRWSLEAYPGLVTRHPSLIAGVLFRDFRRERDDATVLIGSSPESFATPISGA